MPKSGNSSLTVTRDKEICQSHMIEVMASLPPEVEYPMEPCKWGLLTLSSSILKVIFLSLGKSKLTPLVHFY